MRLPEHAQALQSLVLGAFDTAGHCRPKANRPPSPRHSALVADPTKIHGGEVVMEDIRAGFGLAVAAVMASGDSLLSGIHHLERGYDNVLEKFTTRTAAGQP